MTCETALLLISGHIDGVNTDAEEAELQAHLSECAGCRAVLAAYERAEAGLRELEQAPPEGFARGVMYRIGQQTGTEKKPRRRFLGPGTGIGLVAAMLVLLLGTGLIRLPGLSEKTAAPAGEQAMDAAPAETESLTYGLAAPQAPVAANEELFRTEEKTAEGGKADSFVFDLPAEMEPLPSGTTLRDANLELCKQLNAPVLCYAEFGTELIALTQRYAPQLGERLAQLTPERAEDGTLRYKTDTRTVLALHEWLLGQLPRTEDGDEAVLRAETALILRTQELDPDYGFLADVITLPEIPERIVWPETWGADWADRFRTEQSWSLCFPDEKTLPKGSDTAYLILTDGG